MRRMIRVLESNKVVHEFVCMVRMSQYCVTFQGFVSLSK